jgi:diadenosine tetraphosphate (Ap4A) HIT family hydrolase
MPSPSPHATLLRFGYPGTLVHEGVHWAVLVRPAQPTLGSLVLCARGEQTSYSDLPVDAFAEQGELVARIERTLRSFSAFERINYLMLMMVDPHVHFHVLPRYGGERTFGGRSFADKGWPGLADLSATSPATEDLIRSIQHAWNAIS